MKEIKITNQLENIRPIGDIRLIIDYEDGSQEKRNFKNTVLTKGKEALASSLANSFGNSYDFFISRMLFGDGGTSGGVPKFVNAGRAGLFGTTRASKPVIATIDPETLTKLSILSVLTKNDANGFALNEMALQMGNGDIYSMATFADVNKTSAAQLTWIWDLNFI